MNDSDAFNVLFLCTGNSARSILGEALLNHLGGQRFKGFSAGSFPKEEVHPQSLRLLNDKGFSTESLRSKSWDEFVGNQAPTMNLVVTVCDNAANETCPIWQGAPITVHWGLPDFAAAADDAQPEAFQATYDVLQARLEQLVALPAESLSAADLRDAIARIN